MNKTKTTLLGAHMSIAGGIEQSLYRGSSIGCTAIQIFTHSNRQWSIKNLTTEDQTKFIKAKEKTDINSIVVHASYLINLATKNPETLEKSIITLEQELIRCDFLGIEYLVLHPGSSEKENEALDQIAENINKVLNKKEYKCTILLEIMAGQGNSVAYTFEQLKQISSQIKDSKRIGFCFDTCHAWASGYNFSTPEDYKKMWQKFDSILGIENLRAIHLNDSKKECGSRIDRHEDIGKGKIGIEAFKLIMNDQRFVNIPKILETPYIDLEKYKQELELLREL